MSPSKSKPLKSGPVLIVLLSKAPWYAGPLLLGSIVYAFGFVLSFAQGNLGLFLSEPIVPLVVIDSVWVSGAIVRAYRTHEKLYGEADMLFHYETKTRHLHAFIATLKSDKRILLFAIIPILFLDSVATLIDLHQILVAPRIYSLMFSTQASFLFCLATLALAGYFYGAGVYLLLRHLMFVRTLSKQPLDLDLMEDRLLHHGARKLKELKDVVKFSFDISVIWLIAVLILALAVSPVGQLENIATLAFLGASVIVGFVLFLVPQYYLHKSIVDGKIRLNERQNARFEAEQGPIGNQLTSEQRLLLLNMHEHIDKLEAWPADIEFVLIDIAVSLIPIAVTIGLRV